MKQYQEHDLIMLPSKEKTILYLSDFNKILNKGSNSYYHTGQHLYITSNDEIKEGWGGWAYKYDVKGKIFKHFYTENPWYKDAKKIIATTDKSLEITKSVIHSSPNNISGKRKELIVESLPQIPQQFIEYFITEYNKGNIITKVLVEYTCGEKAQCMCNSNEDCLELITLINPDNTINIKPIEVKIYSKSDVISWLKKYREHAWRYGSTQYTLNKWIRENL